MTTTHRTETEKEALMMIFKNIDFYKTVEYSTLNNVKNIVKGVLISFEIREELHDEYHRLAKDRYLF